MSSVTQKYLVIKPACCDMFLFHLVMKIVGLLKVLRGATNGNSSRWGRFRWEGSFLSVIFPFQSHPRLIFEYEGNVIGDFP